MQPGKLVARWSKRERDVLYDWGDGVSKSDASFLNTILTGKRHHPFDDTWSPGFIEDMEARGYDISTLRFSIQKRKA